MTRDALANWQILTNLYKRLAANDDINGSEARALQSVITKLWHDGTAEPPIIEWHQRGGDTASVPTTHICPVCGGTLESRGGYIRVIIGKRDMTNGIQGASWYCAECDRAWDYGDLPSNTRQLADCPEKRTQSATTDACDRLRWLLTQAERVITVDDADRQAVDRACKLLKEIDNGFDRVRR